DVGFIAQVRGEVGHVLHAIAQAVGGNVGEAAFHAGRPIPAVGDRQRHAGRRLALIGSTVGPLKIDKARPVAGVHERRVLLAEAKVAEVEMRMPQAERISATRAACAAPLKKSPSMKVWTFQSQKSVGVHVSIAKRLMRPLMLKFSPISCGT